MNGNPFMLSLASEAAGTEACETSSYMSQSITWSQRENVIKKIVTEIAADPQLGVKCQYRKKLLFSSPFL
jgi:hypothetical protein